MAKILIITHGRVAMFQSTAALASRLLAAGHTVFYGSPDELASEVEATGMSWVQMPALQLHRSWPKVQLEVEELSEKVRATAPDLLLIDIELHAHVLSCLPLGPPIGLLSPFISIAKTFGLPPLHSPVVPGHGWRGSALWAEWLWFRFRLRKWARRWFDRLRRAGRDDYSLLRRLARHNGVRFNREVTAWQWLIPFSYRRLPVLSLTPRELDFSPRPAPGVRHCGPLIEERWSDRRVPEADRARLQDLYERRRSGSCRALVLCSLSTFLTADPQFINRLAAAVESRPDWQLVVAPASVLPTRQLDSLPDNVHLFSWIPQLEVLQAADCAVINAGTSIAECVYRGVPMVVYSLHFNDQNGNAARVAFHGLGVVGDRERDDAATMRAHIETVLTDDAYRRKAAAWGDSLTALPSRSAS